MNKELISFCSSKQEPYEIGKKADIKCSFKDNGTDFTMLTKVRPFVQQDTSVVRNTNYPPDGERVRNFVVTVVRKNDYYHNMTVKDEQDREYNISWLLENPSKISYQEVGATFTIKSATIKQFTRRDGTLGCALKRCLL